jgi:hypothetical protein
VAIIPGAEFFKNLLQAIETTTCRCGRPLTKARHHTLLEPADVLLGKIDKKDIKNPPDATG